MTFDGSNLKAVVFDYGNTLIEFTARQLEHNDTALAEALTQLYGEVDFDRLHAIRNADRRAPYNDGYVENDLPTITTAMVEQLYGRSPTEAELSHLLDVRFTAFVESIEAQPWAYEVLQALRDTGRFKLGLLSNYPSGQAIRASLDRLGLSRFFDSIVVSGDVGHVKPHPAVFEKALAELEVQPDQAVYIGDNWLADIQGGKRAGMAAIHITQYDTPEKFDRESDHVDADAIISHLDQLPKLLADEAH